MRSDYESQGRLRLMMPATAILMISLTVAFALQQIDLAYFNGSYLDYLKLSDEGLRRGYIWQLITFQFLHTGFSHFFWNLVSVWFIGRFVEDRLGKANFFKLYFLSGIAGGLLQVLIGLAVPRYFGGPTVGASAGICGLLAAFATYDPEMVILVCFILPMPAKYLLYFSFAVALFFTIVPTEPGIAHAAHLGGLIFGAAYVYYRTNRVRHLAEWNPLHRKLRREKMIKAATVKPLRLRRQAELEEPRDEIPEEFISREVDPILDKISAHGIQSLTERERQILQAARARMSKQ